MQNTLQALKKSWVVSKVVVRVVWQNKKLLVPKMFRKTTNQLEFEEMPQKPPRTAPKPQQQTAAADPKPQQQTPAADPKPKKTPDEPKKQKSCIAFMITIHMRQHLADLGYTKQQVGCMTPQLASVILEKEYPPKKGMKLAYSMGLVSNPQEILPPQLWEKIKKEEGEKKPATIKTETKNEPEKKKRSRFESEPEMKMDARFEPKSETEPKNGTNPTKSEPNLDSGSKSEPQIEEIELQSAASQAEADDPLPRGQSAAQIRSEVESESSKKKESEMELELEPSSSATRQMGETDRLRAKELLEFEKKSKMRAASNKVELAISQPKASVDAISPSASSQQSDSSSKKLALPK